MQKQYLVIIGAGTLQVPAIKEAQKLGLKTVVVDQDSQAEGMLLADRVLLESTKSYHQIIEKLKPYQENLAGVFTAGTDATMTVAKIAQAFHLISLDEQTALNCTNKYFMRQTLQNKGIPVPLFSLATTAQEAQMAFEKLNTSVAIIKPLDNMGARGVKKIYSPQDAYESFEQTAQYSSSGHVLIEEYLEGDELSIDSLLFHDQFYACGIADRLIERDPYFIEVGHRLPSLKPQNEIDQALKMLYEGAKALGIHYGVAKGDIRLTSQGSRIVEIAGRLSGGFMSGYTFPYASGVNLTRAAILLAIGKIPSEEDLTPSKHSYSLERAIFPPIMGTLQNIVVPEISLQIPFIKNIFITKTKGTVIESISSNVDKLGNIIANAPTLAQAEQAIQQAMSLIQIKIEPLTC